MLESIARAGPSALGPMTVPTLAVCPTALRALAPIALLYPIGGGLWVGNQVALEPGARAIGQGARATAGIGRVEFSRPGLRVPALIACRTGKTGAA